MGFAGTGGVEEKFPGLVPPCRAQYSLHVRRLMLRRQDFQPEKKRGAEALPLL
jgi:hypothetical protein